MDTTHNSESKEMEAKEPGRGVKMAIQWDSGEVVCVSTIRATAPVKVNIPPEPMRRVIFFITFREPPVPIQSCQWREGVTTKNRITPSAGV